LVGVPAGPPRADAGLTGLELGEVICIPGLQDPELLEQAASQQRAIFQTATPGQLAGRYAAQR
jgi:hypothetical protein